MFAICCTRKLLDRGASFPLKTPVEPTTILGNWYASILFAKPQQLVLCVSERTLLPVVVTAKDIKKLPDRLASATKEMLLTIGVPLDQAEAEFLEMTCGYLAVTSNRSILGSLNDLMYHLNHGLVVRPEHSHSDRSLRLAQIPLRAIGYAYSSEATLTLFAAAHASTI